MAAGAFLTTQTSLPTQATLPTQAMSASPVTVEALMYLMGELNAHLVKTKQVSGKSALPPVMKHMRVKGHETIHTNLLAFMSLGGVELLEWLEEPPATQRLFPTRVLATWKAMAAEQGLGWTVALLIHKWAAQVSSPVAQRMEYVGAVRVGAAGKVWHAVVRVGADSQAVLCKIKGDPREAASVLHPSDSVCKNCCKAGLGDSTAEVEEFATLVGVTFEPAARAPAATGGRLPGFVALAPAGRKSGAKRVTDAGIEELVRSHTSGSGVSGSRAAGSRVSPSQVSGGGAGGASAGVGGHSATGPRAAVHRLSGAPGAFARVGSPLQVVAVPRRAAPARASVLMQEDDEEDDLEVEEEGRGPHVEEEEVEPEYNYSRVGTNKIHVEDGCGRFASGFAIDAPARGLEDEDVCVSCRRGLSARV